MGMQATPPWAMGVSFWGNLQRLVPGIKTTRGLQLYLVWVNTVQVSSDCHLPSSQPRFNGNTAFALPHARLRSILRKYGRLTTDRPPSL